MSFDAIIVAGGSGTRLGGRDKAELVVAGGRLLDIVIAACADAQRTVVVGPRRPTARGVVWTCEDPPGGGPCAAVVAGLQHVTAAVVVLLAVDLPHLTPALVRRLAADAPVIAVDGDGREQWLLSAWPTEVLRGLPDHGSLARALGPLTHATQPVGSAAADIDTPDDLRQAATSDSTSTTPPTTRTS